MKRRQKLTINGETQWRSFESSQELVAIVEEIINEKKKPEKAGKTFRQYMLDWYAAYKEPTLGAGTRANYQSIMKTHIFPAIGDKDISDVSVADVQRIMNSLKSASMSKQVKSAINLVIDSAIYDGLYHRPNPTQDKRLNMSTKVKKRGPISKRELATIMKHLPQLQADQARILALMLMTGARRGEVLGARWEDINWEEKKIHLQRVVRFINNRPVVSTKMKTPAANRAVSLWENLLPYLGTPQKSGFIINDQGEPLSERQYRNRWTALMKSMQKIGVGRFTAHQLRHTYATVAANSGYVAPKVLQGMLGHANCVTTMNIYASLDNEKILESSSQLSSIYTKIEEEIAGKLQ